jgi:hypothetical protein
MTPRLHVHVERVVLHGLPPVPPEELAVAIETALADSLAGRAAAERPSAAGPPPVGTQVALAVAPAVLGAAGLADGGRR